MRMTEAGAQGLIKSYATENPDAVTRITPQDGYVIIGDEKTETPTTNGAGISLPDYAGEDTAFTKIQQKTKEFFEEASDTLDITALLLLLAGALVLRAILK